MKKQKIKAAKVLPLTRKKANTVWELAYYFQEDAMEWKKNRMYLAFKTSKQGGKKKFDLLEANPMSEKLLLHLGAKFYVIESDSSGKKGEIAASISPENVKAVYDIMLNLEDSSFEVVCPLIIHLISEYETSANIKQKQ